MQGGSVFESHTGLLLKSRHQILDATPIKIILTERKHNNRNNQINRHHKHKKNEKSMISHTDTVVNPGAVMIKSLHASITKGTVPRSIRSNNLTIRTKIARIEFLNESL